MCGRYALESTLKDLEETYGAIPDGYFEMEASYNVAPTDIMPVIVESDKGHRTVTGYRWGLVPPWSKEIPTSRPLINARSETLSVKKTFLQPFRTKRCVIPASGFFEWKKGSKGKTPHYITLSTDRLMSFAGLYEHWKYPDGRVLGSYAIITTPASTSIEPLHDRMPAILLPEEIDIWLDSANHDIRALGELLTPYAKDGTKYHTVSKQVNNVRNNGASLIEPLRDLFG